MITSGHGTDAGYGKAGHPLVEYDRTRTSLAKHRKPPEHAHQHGVWPIWLHCLREVFLLHHHPLHIIRALTLLPTPEICSACSDLVKKLAYGACELKSMLFVWFWGLRGRQNRVV